MYVASNFAASKRFRKVFTAILFTCLITVYTVPSVPSLLIPPSRETNAITDDISLGASDRHFSTHTRNKLCSAHKVPPFQRDASHVKHRRKVYDLFMLNTELEWLEIRLHELASQVDYFVILEAPTTFTGLPKPMYFQDHKAMFQEFQDKIIHHVLVPPAVGHPAHVQNSTLVPGTPAYESQAWTVERYQRNAMFTQVLPFLTDGAAPNKDDVIIVSDIDEIPRPATVRLLRECHFGRMTTLRSRFYYYSFQWLHRGQEWAHPQATTYQGPNYTLLPASLRELDGSVLSIPRSERRTIWNSSWHCSSCFSTIAEMLEKMQSFSHVSLNVERYRDKQRIVQRIREGKDLWDRWFQWYVRVDNNHDIPEYLIEEAKKGRFSYMLDRDGDGAGFEDYVQNSNHVGARDARVF